MDESRKTKFSGSCRAAKETPCERPPRKPEQEADNGLIYIGETAGSKPTKYFIVVRFAEDE